MLTTDPIECVQSHKSLQIHDLVWPIMLQCVGENLAILFKHMHELFQDLEVECWRDHFASSRPFGTRARQQARFQPLVEDLVLEMFFVVLAAAQYRLENRM